MKASDKLKDAIRGWESCQLKAYKCPAGKWTVGYGHTGKDVYAGLEINYKEAEQLLDKDLIRPESAINAMKIAKTQGQFDALVDFVFNCGLGALQESTLLKYIREGKPAEEIQAQFMRWDKITKTVINNGKAEKVKVSLPGLTKRRRWEADRWIQ